MTKENKCERCGWKKDGIIPTNPWYEVSKLAVECEHYRLWAYILAGMLFIETLAIYLVWQ